MFKRSLAAAVSAAALLISVAACSTQSFDWRTRDRRSRVCDSAAHAQTANGQTRLLRTPTVSATQIAFAYANNIWTVPRAGGSARRLTSFQGQTSNPHFSPDGKWIAFSGEYAGNFDVYVVAAEGGEPRRLTWHPGARSGPGLDARRQVGSVFIGARDAGRRAARRDSGLCRLTGGVEEPMALPRAYQGKISADGTRIAYRMNNSWDEERRNYRGGQNRPIWIVDLKTYDLVSPPWTDSKDVDPVWVDDAVYFISDRDGVANVWEYQTKTKKLTQVTKFTDFDVKAMDSGAGSFVFEQAGYVHELDPKSGKRTRRQHHRRRRLSLDDAELGRRHQSHDQHGAVADRQTRRGRSARRDLHHPRRERRRSQPDKLERLSRTRSRLVARRQVRFLLQRQVRRVSTRTSKRRTD